jgi:hypothetical protein
MPKAEQTVQREVSRAIEEWLLSILRFAITLDELDRAAVLAMATHMDRRTFGFTFFARTSIKACDAIAAKDGAEAIATLRVFVRQIEHLLLRRAFEAVLDIRSPGADQRAISTRTRERLWQGLPTKGGGTASWPKGQRHTS